MRKLLLLSAAFCCITTLATAQIEKGRVQLQGGFSYSNTEVDRLDNSNLFIQPQVGFFVSDKISIGPSLAYQRTSTPTFNPGNGNVEDRVVNQFQFGAFARFHRPMADNFYLFAESSFAIGTGNVDGAGNNDTNLSSFNFNIRPGAMYFLSDKFALELNLTLFSFSSQEIGTGGNATDVNQFSIGTNLSSVGVGLSYFLK